jgi:hypothetical protein
VNALEHLEDVRDELEHLLVMLEREGAKADQEQDAFDSLYSRAFLEAEGSVDQRKHLASERCRKQGLRPDIAKGVVRRIEQRMKVLMNISDIDRTLAASERVVT